MESKIYLGQNSLIRVISCTQFAYPRNWRFATAFRCTQVNPFIGPSSVVLVMRFGGHKLILKHSN